MTERSRLKDQEWTFAPNASGSYSHDVAMLAALMDIRDELKRINMLLRCQNFLEIPLTLREIKRNTNKRRKR